MMDERYKIVRMYKDNDKRKRTIASNLTLDEAQEHCKREDTHKYDKNGRIEWFDGYTKM